jgi:periplasmic divalent cation tolerance protein
LLAVFTTVATHDEAKALAASLVERRLVACAQISQVESVYRWQGVLQQEGEWRLMLKTTSARYEQVEAAIRERHAYELPAIYAMPVENAFERYAAWVRGETT